VNLWLFFSWGNDIAVGNSLIDGDHQKLIKLVNDFHDAMEQGRGNDVIGKVLNNLVIYTKEHFKREEAEMQRIKYPRSLAHKLEHDKLIDEIAQLQASFASGKSMLTIKISKFSTCTIRKCNSVRLVFAKFNLT